MVGGIVVEVCDVPGEPSVLFVDCHDTKYRQRCGVHVDRVGGVNIQVGDSLWWQGQWCYWTPANPKDAGTEEHDIKIRKMSNSGVRSPAERNAT